MSGGVHTVLQRSAGVVTIRVCTGSGCAMNGSLAVADALETTIFDARQSERFRVVRTGCHGLCQLGPVVVVDPEVFYPEITPERARRILERLVATGEHVEELLYRESRDSEPVRDYSDIGFNAAQRKIVLRNCGVIDPESIEDAVERGGYESLRKVLREMAPEDVIGEVTASGLRGRGGAGFLTGTKWRLTRDAEGDRKVAICNADEGDPGAFMDRSVLESDPHTAIEGLAVAAYAVGAEEGYVYVRHEYPLAVRRLRKAIDDAYERGLLGADILGSGVSFDLKVREGAGAFVCGEETALMRSLEGRRGMPRPRPPFPAVSGLWGRPTVINNVETLANVPWIIRNGGQAYSAIGTGDSKGTKVFALTGKVKLSGLVEVPMGVTLRELVYDVGGGIEGGGRCKAVQVGGPSGGCVPEELLDTPVEYSALAEVGAIVGSGGLVVVDDRTCMVDLAKYFLAFTQMESCGKCVPCRIGTKRMLEIVERVSGGEGREGDIELLERLALHVKQGSLCGLGQTAPNPVLTTLRYFREEYEEHIREGRCRAGACTDLTVYTIDPERCTGCHACVRACPVNAISGEPKGEHSIDPSACIACAACVSRCRFQAIEPSGREAAAR